MQKSAYYLFIWLVLIAGVFAGGYWFWSLYWPNRADRDEWPAGKKAWQEPHTISDALAIRDGEEDVSPAWVFDTFRRLYEKNPDGFDEIHYAFGELLATDPDQLLPMERYLAEDPKALQYTEQLLERTQQEAKNPNNTQALYRLATYAYWQNNRSLFDKCNTHLRGKPLKYLPLMTAELLDDAAVLDDSEAKLQQRDVQIIHLYLQEIAQNGAIGKAETRLKQKVEEVCEAPYNTKIYKASTFYRNNSALMHRVKRVLG